MTLVTTTGIHTHTPAPKTEIKKLQEPRRAVDASSIYPPTDHQYLVAHLDLLVLQTRPPFTCHASPALDITCLAFSAQMTGWKQIELVFCEIHVAVENGEDNTSNKRDDGHGAIVPRKIW